MVLLSLQANAEILPIPIYQFACGVEATLQLCVAGVTVSALTRDAQDYVEGKPGEEQYGGK